MTHKAQVREKIVVWGAGGHAKVVVEILRLVGGYEIVGFLDDINRDRWGGEFCDARILGGSERLSALRAAGVENLALGVGDCQARLKMIRTGRRLGFSFPKIIHPGAIVSAEATISEGTVVVAGAVINPGSKLGAAVVVNTSALVDHDCVIGDGAHICPGARLAGGVRIEEGAWVGLGAVIIERLSVGKGAYIGAGAVVLKNVPESVLAYGVPARIVRKL